MKKLIVNKITLLIGLLISTCAIAQDSINSIENDNLPPVPEKSGSSISIPFSSLEFNLSICVLTFGLLIIIIEVYLITKRKINSHDTIKFVTITLIITGTLFLITAGYSNDQIAPAVGLLGTIAGYLLGRIQNSNE